MWPSGSRPSAKNSSERHAPCTNRSPPAGKRLGIRRYDVNTGGEYQLFAVDERAERFRHLFDKSIAPLGRKPRDFLGHWKRGEMAGDELRRQWELRGLDRRTHVHIS